MEKKQLNKYLVVCDYNLHPRFKFRMLCTHVVKSFPGKKRSVIVFFSNMLLKMFILISFRVG